jgi:hypothetical protein
MLFVLTITLWSLVTMAISHARASSGFDIDFLNALAATALVVLALYLVVEGIRKGRAERIERVTAEVSI